MLSSYSSTESAIVAVLLIALVGIVLTTVEDLRRSDVFSPGGVLSWTVLRTFGRPASSPVLRRALDPLFRPLTHRRLLWLRLVVVALMLATLARWLPGARWLLAGLTLVLLWLLLLHNARSIFGLDGAHHMNTVILLAAGLLLCTSPGSLVAKIGVGFIGAQAVLAYVVSGVAKLMDSSWRNGEAIAGIMSTTTYGHAWLGRWLRRHPKVSLLGCWVVIVTECAFVVVPFADGPLLMVMLAGGLLFHLGTAVFMGLNGFLFAFVATYPAIVWANYALRGVLPWTG